MSNEWLRRGLAPVAQLREGKLATGLTLCACSLLAMTAGTLRGPAREALPSAAEDLALVLRRAGAATAALEESLAITIAREEYSQSLLLGPDNSPRVRRKLVSDVAWVPTGDAIVWAFVRDVLSVDGEAVRDREARLDALFEGGAGPEARARATKILEESARYNLGPRRNLNHPTVALSVLHPRNQPRFRFQESGADRVDSVATLKVRFAEASRPTLIRTSSGKDVPAGGFHWIEPETGSLVASEIQLEVSGMRVEIRVSYRLHPRLAVWLPAEMREAYGNRTRSAGEERVEATARYSDYRRARVELLPIQPIR